HGTGNGSDWVRPRAVARGGHPVARRSASTPSYRSGPHPVATAPGSVRSRSRGITSCMRTNVCVGALLVATLAISVTAAAAEQPSGLAAESLLKWSYVGAPEISPDG